MDETLLSELKAEMSNGTTDHKLARFLMKRNKIPFKIARQYINSLQRLGCLILQENDESDQTCAFATIKMLAQKGYSFKSIAETVAQKHSYTVYVATNHMYNLVNLKIVNFLEFESLNQNEEKKRMMPNSIILLEI